MTETRGGVEGDSDGQPIVIPVQHEDVEMDCRNCGHCSHRIFQNAPAKLFGGSGKYTSGSSESGSTNGKALCCVAVCEHCGGSQVLEVSSEYENKFMDELVSYLLDNEIITEEEAEEMK